MFILAPVVKLHSHGLDHVQSQSTNRAVLQRPVQCRFRCILQWIEPVAVIGEYHDCRGP